MSRNSKSIRLFDASGGLNSKAPVTSLELNQAIEIQNMNLLPSGGFTKRNGNTAFNSSAMTGATAVHGLFYFRLSSGSDFLVAIHDNEIYKADDLDGTMDDITGAVTITTGQDNIWTAAVLNDLLIMCGGVDGANDAPLKYSGSGNAAALGGTPPEGGFCIAANNRLFIGDIDSNRSRIQWSILGNPESWTASGSGSQDVSKNDGDTLVGAAQLNIDHLILFKQNSMHDLVIRNAPFPLFPIRRGPGIGAVSKRAILNVNNLIYYVTPEPRMKATDGRDVFDFPDTVDDLWDGLNKSRLKYIQGVYYPKLKQIMWFCSNTTATTHDLAIIWDVERKAWLKHPQGYKMNAACIARDRLLYAGAYDGKIYKQDDSTSRVDVSESSAAINGYRRSGWIDFEAMLNTKVVPYLELNLVSQGGGAFEFGYGFDFAEDRRILPFSMYGPGDKWGQFLWNVGVWGSRDNLTKLAFLKGRGKYFQFLIRHKGSDTDFAFNGVELPVKPGPVTVMR